jgi:hypothetical protein
MKEVNCLEFTNPKRFPPVENRALDSGERENKALMLLVGNCHWKMAMVCNCEFSNHKQLASVKKRHLSDLKSETLELHPFGLCLIWSWQYVAIYSLWHDYFIQKPYLLRAKRDNITTVGLRMQYWEVVEVNCLICKASNNCCSSGSIPTTMFMCSMEPSASLQWIGCVERMQLDR